MGILLTRLLLVLCTAFYAKAQDPSGKVEESLTEEQVDLVNTCEDSMAIYIEENSLDSLESEKGWMIKEGNGIGFFGQMEVEYNKTTTPHCLLPVDSGTGKPMGTCPEPYQEPCKATALCISKFNYEIKLRNVQCYGMAISQ